MLPRRGRGLMVLLKVLMVLCLSPALTAFYTDKNVHWLESGSILQRNFGSNNVLDVYCYKGRPKSLLYLWQTVSLLIDINTDNFNLYEAGNPDDVWNAYQTDTSYWSMGLFSSQKPRKLQWDSFNTTCLAISTDQKHTVTLDVKHFDTLKIIFFLIGVFLFLYSKSLSENKIFFYGIGILLGICASFMILVYFISKMLPGKPIIYGSMIGGWAVGLYFFNFIWSNFQPLLIAYKEYVVWYTIIMGFISFIICYKIGTPKDSRNKNIISWTLQGVALAIIYYSTNIAELVIIIASILFIIKYTPSTWIRKLKMYWLTKYPPKRVLLTEEQYYEQGKKETAKALEELRGYCSSPECNQWRLMLQLKNSEKFAKFMSGTSHVSDSEIDEHETSDFKIRKPSKLTVSSTLNDDNFTSDDSSFSPDEF